MGSENIKFLEIIRIDRYSWIGMVDSNTLLGVVKLDHAGSHTKFLGYSVQCRDPFTLLLSDKDLGLQFELYIKFAPLGAVIPTEMYVYIPYHDDKDPSSRIIYSTITASDIVDAIENYCNPTHYGTNLMSSTRGFDDYVWRLETDESSLGEGFYIRRW